MATKRKRKKVVTVTGTPVKSMFYISEPARRFVGVGIGAAAGAMLGLLFAEDPDGFTKTAVTWFSTIKSGISTSDRPIDPVEGVEVWWQKRIPAVWHSGTEDGVEHAYALGLDEPGNSACGEVRLTTIGPKSTKGRCLSCWNILDGLGYKDLGPKPPFMPREAPPPPKASARRGKRSTKKTASA